MQKKAISFKIGRLFSNRKETMGIPNVSNVATEDVLSTLYPTE